MTLTRPLLELVAGREGAPRSAAQLLRFFPGGENLKLVASRMPKASRVELRYARPRQGAAENGLWHPYEPASTRGITGTEYTEDSRNLEAAALLDKLAASVETVAPDLLAAYSSLRDDYMNSEQHSEMVRQIGFHSWPETAEDFVKACIADRAMRA